MNELQNKKLHKLNCYRNLFLSAHTENAKNKVLPTHCTDIQTFSIQMNKRCDVTLVQFTSAQQLCNIRRWKRYLTLTIENEWRRVPFLFSSIVLGFFEHRNTKFITWITRQLSVLMTHVANSKKVARWKWFCNEIVGNFLLLMTWNIRPGDTRERREKQSFQI